MSTSSVETVIIRCCNLGFSLVKRDLCVFLTNWSPLKVDSQKVVLRTFTKNNLHFLFYLIFYKICQRAVQKWPASRVVSTSALADSLLLGLSVRKTMWS